MSHAKDRPAVAYLRELAAKCRRRASVVSDDPAATALGEVAADLESIANRLKRGDEGPSLSATRAIRE